MIEVKLAKDVRSIGNAYKGVKDNK